jgi:hypothetical protein
MCEKEVHKCTVFILCESQREWFTAILLITLVIHNLKLEINTCNYLMGTSLFYHFLWIKGKTIRHIHAANRKTSSPPFLQ